MAKRLQCKHIPDAPILQFLASGEREWKTHLDGGDKDWCIPFDPSFPNRLRIAKMTQLMRRGLVDGCNCGCRGDWQLTDKGREWVKQYQKQVEITLEMKKLVFDEWSMVLMPSNPNAHTHNPRSIWIEWLWEFTERSPRDSALEGLRDWLQRGRGLQVEIHATPNPIRNCRGEVMTDEERFDRQQRMYAFWQEVDHV